MFREDLRDRYYHLHLPLVDGLRLGLYVETHMYVLLMFNCGLPIAPWCFIRAMVPIFVLLRRMGNQEFLYLGNYWENLK